MLLTDLRAHWCHRSVWMLWESERRRVCGGNDTFAIRAASRRAERPRVRRDLTVPRLTSRISAISS